MFDPEYALDMFSALSGISNGASLGNPVNGVEIHDAYYVFQPSMLDKGSVMPGIFIDFSVIDSEHTGPLGIGQIVCAASAAMERLGTWELSSVDFLIPQQMKPRTELYLSYHMGHLWDDLSRASGEEYAIDLQVRSGIAGNPEFRNNLHALLAQEPDVIKVEQSATPSGSIINQRIHDKDYMDVYKSKMAVTDNLTFKLPSCKAADLGLLAEIVFHCYQKGSQDDSLLSFTISK
ncbi:hypothetical protein [Boudabousia marimammalium]|uniref:hypothetical protein n=1 Tax=Boudabousia marimammalium TaxID=156892 RepID=UPI001300F136|nr:hypothetical protein [Boudabousia marimammalium]